MREILAYRVEHEPELLALLAAEPDWREFMSAESLPRFCTALRDTLTLICLDDGRVCGYLRALVDGFGVYVSELYVAPAARRRGHGRALLQHLRDAHAGQDVFVLSDEDAYYEKLGCARVGSVFRL